MRRLSKVKIEWSSKMAYVVGLLATDGCLSIDGRHIDFTSKDLEIVEIFKDYLNLNNKIGKKSRGSEKEKKYFRIQFGDKNFYEFLLSIGISPRKSKTIGFLKIPNSYFSDFLRGCIDGDGSIGIFWHPESRHPQLRVRIFSASKNFLFWIKNKIKLFNILGGHFQQGNRVYILVYSKADSIKLLNKIYYKNFPCSLSRKFLIARSYLRT